MTAVLHPTDALRRDRTMSLDDNEITYVRGRPSIALLSLVPVTLLQIGGPSIMKHVDLSDARCFVLTH